MMVLHILLASEGDSFGAIFVTLISGNIKYRDFPGLMEQQVFLINLCKFISKYSTLLQINPSPRKYLARFPINILRIKNIIENVDCKSIESP